MRSKLRGARPPTGLRLLVGSARPATGPAARELSAEELWARLEALPEHLKGEIIDGELYVQPRPRPRHARGIGYLGRFLGGSFDYDEGGPGGWRRENLPELPPEGEPFRTVPDWVCEVLSSGNARYDQQTKAPFHASIGVPWLWMVDTRSKLIEVRRLEQQKWVVEAVFTEERDARMPPFDAIAVPLHRLWV